VCVDSAECVYQEFGWDCHRSVEMLPFSGSELNLNTTLGGDVKQEDLEFPFPETYGAFTCCCERGLPCLWEHYGQVEAQAGPRSNSSAERAASVMDS
jgi:hypothetical protein